MTKPHIDPTTHTKVHEKWNRKAVPVLKLWTDNFRVNWDKRALIFWRVSDEWDKFTEFHRHDAKQKFVIMKPNMEKEYNGYLLSISCHS